MNLDEIKSEYPPITGANTMSKKEAQIRFLLRRVEELEWLLKCAKEDAIKWSAK